MPWVRHRRRLPRWLLPTLVIIVLALLFTFGMIEALAELDRHPTGY